jgi:cobalt/nickel transport system permease protein
LEEVNRITTAYSLRAPGQKGVHYKVWGSLTGQLLLRSMDRAQNVYDSMTLRGYNGDFDYLADSVTCKCGDVMYLLFWVILLAIFRWIPIIALVGSLF